MADGSAQELDNGRYEPVVVSEDAAVAGVGVDHQ